MAEIEINNTEELNEQLNKIVRDSSINKPSKEEIQQAKEEFEKALNEWKNKIYTIGKPEEAQEICDYIRYFIKKRFIWHKDAWMGVIKLTEELDAAEILFKGKKDESLKVGYRALEFIYYALTNPGGIGLEEAIEFEKEHERYIKIAVYVAKELEKARKELKNIDFLQQRWAAMEQGFYLELEPEENKENEENENEEINSEKGDE